MKSRYNHQEMDEIDTKSLWYWVINRAGNEGNSGLVTPLLPWITGELSRDSSSWRACSRSCCSWGSWYTLFIRSCWSLHLQRTRQWILLGRSGTVLAGGPYVPMSCKQQALGFSMALDPCWTARSSQAGNSWKGRKKLLVSRHVVPLWTWVHGGGHNTIHSSTFVGLRRTEEVTIFLSWTSMRGQPIVGNKYGSWHQPEQHGCKLTSGFTERIGAGGVDSQDVISSTFLDTWPIHGSLQLSDLFANSPNFTATQPETRPTLLKLSISSQFILVTTLQGVGPQLWDFFGKVGGYIGLLTLVFNMVFVKKFPESGVAQVYEARTFIGNKVSNLLRGKGKEDKKRSEDTPAPLSLPPGMFMDTE